MKFTLLLLLLSLSACVLVPQNRRGQLADPMMISAVNGGDMLEVQKQQKFYSAREGAAGGSGAPAGGGCACQ